MSKHRPDGLPKGSKWGVCKVCGYRIRQKDDFESVSDDEIKYAHARCAPEYDEGVDDAAE